MRKKERDREYYSLSLRVERNTPLADWLDAQDSKSASLKALINLAINTYGNQDVIQAAMQGSKIGMLVAREIDDPAPDRPRLDSAEDAGSKMTVMDEQVSDEEAVAAERINVKEGRLTTERKKKPKARAAKKNWRDMM